MINIVKFEDKYFEKLKEIDFMMWLRVRWDSTINSENVFAAVDDEKNLLGICALCYDGTWYYIDEKRTDIPLYRMQMELCISDNIDNSEKVERELINSAKQRLQQIKKDYPEKKICIRCWCDEKEYDKQQQLLELGFTGNNIVWIMGFELDTAEIPKLETPENVSVEILDNSDNAIKEYLAANYLGFNNVQDAEGELRFRLGDERTKIFVTRSNGKIVSSVTVWHISDERATTENIFTIPKYRRQKMGLLTVSAAIGYLKELGYKSATLTCVGDNVNAIALYSKIGYKVIGHLLEMHWEI